MPAADLLDGGCITHGVDRAFRAEHPAVLVRDNAPEVRLGAFWKPLLHMQSAHFPAVQPYSCEQCQTYEIQPVN